VTVSNAENIEPFYLFHKNIMLGKGTNISNMHQHKIIQFPKLIRQGTNLRLHLPLLALAWHTLRY
jgi:hypothetical protein